MRFVMLLLVAVVIAGAGLFAWKTFSLDAEVPVAGAEEPSSPQITFRDENGALITAPEDVLLGLKELPKQKFPADKPRVFKRSFDTGGYSMKFAYRDEQVPPAEAGWTEIPYDESTMGPSIYNTGMENLPEKYRAYLERERLKKENPEAAKALLPQPQITVGVIKPSSSTPPPPGEAIALKIPPKPKDPIDAFYYKVTIGEFLRKHSGEGKARDQNALDTMEAFRRLYCAHGATDVDVVMTWLGERSREPIADLLYEICESHVLRDAFSFHNRGPRFVKTTAELERLGYAPYLCMLGHELAANEILSYSADKPELREQARKHIDRADALIPAVLADAEMPAISFERVISLHQDNLEQLDGDPEVRMLKLLALIDQKRPDIGPLCKGSFYLDHGWRARGSGFADTVTQNGWKLLEERLTISRKNLEQAWALQPHPRIASKMVSVCLGQGKHDETRLWYNRGIEIAPGAVALRESYLQAICAKWGGSDEEMFAFARENVQRYQRDPSLSYQTSLLILTAHEEAAPHDPHDREDYFKKPEVYAEIRDTLKFVVKQKPKAVDAWSWLAFYAIKAGDYATAREAFKRQWSEARFLSSVGFGSANCRDQAREKVEKALGGIPAK